MNSRHALCAWTGAGLSAALCTLSFAQADSPASGESKPPSFVSVPAVWSATYDQLAINWISVKRACTVLDGNRQKSLGLQTGDCEYLKLAVRAKDDLADPSGFKALKSTAKRAVAMIRKLNTDCRSQSTPECVDLALTAPPIGSPRTDQISGIAVEDEDRDLDNSQRITTDEQGKPLDSSSAEARFVEG